MTDTTLKIEETADQMRAKQRIKALSETWNDAGTEYAIACASFTAELIRQALPTADRAVFRIDTNVEGYTTISLLLIYAEDGLLWFNPDEQGHRDEALKLQAQGKVIQLAPELLDAVQRYLGYGFEADATCVSRFDDDKIPNADLCLLRMARTIDDREPYTSRITERTVVLHGIRTEQQWRDLERAMGLVPYELGRWKEWAAGEPKVLFESFVGDGSYLDRAMIWAQRNGLTYAAETSVRYEPGPDIDRPRYMPLTEEEIRQQADPDGHISAVVPVELDDMITMSTDAFYDHLSALVTGDEHALGCLDERLVGVVPGGRQVYLRVDGNAAQWLADRNNERHEQRQQ